MNIIDPTKRYLTIGVRLPFPTVFKPAALELVAISVQFRPRVKNRDQSPAALITLPNLSQQSFIRAFFLEKPRGRLR